MHEAVIAVFMAAAFLALIPVACLVEKRWAK